MWFAAFEEYALFILVAGLLMLGIGWIGLIVRAFRQSKVWGWGVLLLPPLGLVFMLVNFKEVRRPTALIFLGLLVSVGVLLVSRYSHLFIDLGPWEKQVNGELHLTLTGWDRKDYVLLKAKSAAVVLQMANPDVTDATLDFIVPMEGLRELDLNDTQLTDAGLAKLQGLKKLEALRLRGTRVTDAGFKTFLAAAPSLKELDVRGTAISPETIKEWKAGAAGRRALADRAPAATKAAASVPSAPTPTKPAPSAPAPSAPAPTKAAA